MIWEAFYAPWDVVKDRKSLSALCLIFDKVRILGLQWGSLYPSNEKEIIEFEKTNYDKVRLGTPSQLNSLKGWHRGLKIKKGLDVPFDELIKIDREIMLQYALDWYPFYNYITPLAEGSDPVIVSVEAKKEPSQHGLYGKCVKITSLEHVKYCSIRNRELGIEIEMKQACEEAGGVLIYDKPIVPYENIEKVELAELLAPLMAFKCVSLVFPCNKTLHPDDILETRYLLNDELIEFRDKMRSFSIDIVGAIGDNIHQKGLLEHVELNVKKVELSLKNVQNKVKSEKKKLMSKMISGYGGFIGLSSLMASFVTNNWWLTVLGIGAQSFLTLRQQKELIESMKRESGLAYLVELDKVQNNAES